MDYIAVSDKSEEVQLEQTLIEAAANGDYNQVVKLLNSGVSVDAEEYIKLLFYASKNYVTPLQISAANGHDKCVQILIEHGADVNAKDRFDVTALHMAAEKGNIFCVKALLHASADYCAPTKFSKVGYYKAVPHLGGTTPLHLAAANNHVDCVKELIQYGADCNAVNETGHTSLYIACKFGFTECVLAHLKNAVSRDILSLPSFDTSDTPLHFAVSNGMIDCVKELIHLGSDVNHINYSGYSPLHLALNPSIEKITDQLELVKLLVLEGYNADINYPDASGFTPLHYVCFNGYRNMWVSREELTKFLLTYGADINIRNHQGFTVLENELKSYSEDLSVLKYIIKCMPQVPPLKLLNLHRRGFPFMRRVHRGRASCMSMHETDPFLETPAERACMQRIAAQHETVSRRRIVAQNESMETTSPNMHDDELRPERQPITRQRIRFRPFQRFAYGSALEESHQPPTTDHNESLGSQNQPIAVQKQEFYEKIASNPLPLQHHCRYVIRNYMGAKKLKYIKNLPIPDALQLYLLLKTEK